MKKLTAILLVVALIFTLSSCWSSCSDAESEKRSFFDSPEETASDKKRGFSIEKMIELIKGKKQERGEEEFDEDTSLGEITPKPGTEKKPEPDKKPKPESIYTISNEDFLVNSDLVITVVEAYSAANGDFVLKIRCKNKTGGAVGMYCENAAVNGYMMLPAWYSEVEANKETDSEMVFSAADLKQAGITVVEEVEFFINVYSLADMTKTYVFDKFTVYPTGLNAGSVTYPGIPHADKGQLILDGGDFKFAIEGVDENGEFGYTLKVYMESYVPGVDAYLFWEDTSVNGIKMDAYWGQTLFGGKRAVHDAPFLREDFTANGITKVDEIEFKLKIVESDDWSKVLFEGVYKYKP